MVIRPHRFSRTKDDLSFHLDFSAWPTDLPLPTGTQPWAYGDVAVPPCWTIKLESTCTMEKMVGIFGVHGAVAETLAWYQAELPARGWAVEDIVVNVEANSWLKYRLAENEAIKLRLNLRDVPGLQLTWLMMQRIITKSYPLLESEATETTHE